MLPAFQTEDHFSEGPSSTLLCGIQRNSVTSLKDFTRRFTTFRRSESRRHFLDYTAGKFSALERTVVADGTCRLC
jgi:hypothetical protein